MFERWSYIGYTLLYCLPPIVLLWARREFFGILRERVVAILLATGFLTVYGSVIWPLALEHRAWAYGDDRILGSKLLGHVYLDDALWWLLVSFLISSFVALSSDYERRGVDIVLREAKGLLRSFSCALRGLRVIPLERNTTIHVAAVVFVLLEGILFGLNPAEWALVALAVGSVLGFELLNSAVERVASRTADPRAGGSREGFSPEIALIKDAAAAGVLVSAVAAGAVGITIFLRRIVEGIS